MGEFLAAICREFDVGLLAECTAALIFGAGWNRIVDDDIARRFVADVFERVGENHLGARNGIVGGDAFDCESLLVTD